MSRTTTFTRGSGLYRCVSCSRSTRDDGNGDSVNLGLCTECYDLGGLHNRLQDGGELSEGERGLIAVSMRVIAERGGRDVWSAIFEDAA